MHSSILSAETGFTEVEIGYPVETFVFMMTLIVVGAIINELEIV